MYESNKHVEVRGIQIRSVMDMVMSLIHFQYSKNEYYLSVCLKFPFPIDKNIKRSKGDVFGGCVWLFLQNVASLCIFHLQFFTFLLIVNLNMVTCTLNFFLMADNQ